MAENNIQATSVDMQNLSAEEQARLLPPLTDAEPDAIAQAAHDALYNKKARNIKIYRVEGKSDIADYMVIGTGTSGTHVKALANEVDYMLELRGLKCRNMEGRDNSAWILVDYGTVIVHVLNREAREFYNLDKLYGAHAVETEPATDESSIQA